MVRDTHNVIPVTLALLLHVLLFGSLIVVLDFGDRARPAVPLAIKGTLVTDNAIVIPPKVEEAPPPRPDTSEQDRRRAEELKRQEDARIEQERLNRIKQQEQERKRAEAEAERKRQADAERRRVEEEAEKERKRVEAERAREAEIERQRLENERLRAEAEAARQAEIDAESNRLDAMTATAEAAYIFAIQQKIVRNWVRPPTATAGIECIVNVRQLPGGEVVNVSLGSCNGDEAVRRSIEAAVYKASPLPAPADPSVFDRNLRLEFRPTD
ncbi:MAG: cell envelope integrity protein TolA [Gammaproteobacteria bacterium]|nr:cell envelope integrity protein TolA [Gammaproteobacteria bacterium]MDH3430323.1 cell envelope integrity protein TolA [Gammaproteobacteria bacterium]MDH3433615.1 cell envelope integrity protein TolA [Gammaproteobacteria bacterium]